MIFYKEYLKARKWVQTIWFRQEYLISHKCVKNVQK